MSLRVFVTGGAGFLGRGILRRIERGGWDWRVTCYSRDETKQDECRRRYPGARYVLGDVCDTERLAAAMSGHDVVIHAAAVKYIPEAELNPAECMRVNVGGAQSVITAARRAGVGTVVGISTDKAVRPVNAYGMTKALTERLFAEAAYRSGASGPRFQTVRYGNVVASTGSVIPLFQRQMREDGYVTVTDPAMTRFWMPVDDAVDTILYAMDPCRLPGSVTIPRPQAMNLGNLAVCIAGGAVKITGPRPGEKQHEELMHASEPMRMLMGAGAAYYELVPRAFAGVMESVAFTAPETCASHTPYGGWVTPERMRAWIQEAAGV